MNKSIEPFLFPDLETIPQNEREGFLEAKNNALNTLLKSFIQNRNDLKLKELLEAVPEEYKNNLELTYGYITALILQDYEEREESNINGRRTKNKAIEKTIEAQGLLLNKHNSNSLLELNTKGFIMDLLPIDKAKDYSSFIVQDKEVQTLSKTIDRDLEIEQASETIIKNMIIQDIQLKDIDLRPLKAVYTLIFKALEKGEIKLEDLRNKHIEIYVEDLNNLVGIQERENKESIPRIVQDLINLQRFYGYFYDKSTLQSIINVISYNHDTNKVKIASGYISNIATQILLEQNTEQDIKLLNSYMVNMTAYKQKDYQAYLIFIRIIRLIEQTGDNKTIPQIKPSTIIAENLQLLESFKADSNKTRWLKRHFKKALELLQTDSNLKDKYINIQLPDPNKEENIPTLKTMNSLIYKFKHSGINPKYKK